MASRSSTYPVTATVLIGLASVVTTSRLVYQFRKRRDGLYADDAFAGLAVFCAVLAISFLWVKDQASGTKEEIRKLSILASWGSSMMFTIILWFTRLSIMFSPVRMVPPRTSVPIVLWVYAGAAAVGIMGLVLLVLRTYFCSIDTRWHLDPNPRCELKQLTAVELTAEIVSSLILVILPVTVQWFFKNVLVQRQLLLALSCVGAIMLVASIWHGISAIHFSRRAEEVVQTIQVATSLVLTNVVAILAFIYRLSIKPATIKQVQQQFENATPEEDSDQRLSLLSTISKALDRQRPKSDVPNRSHTIRSFHSRDVSEDEAFLRRSPSDIEGGVERDSDEEDDQTQPIQRARSPPPSMHMPQVLDIRTPKPVPSIPPRKTSTPVPQGPRPLPHLPPPVIGGSLEMERMRSSSPNPSFAEDHFNIPTNLSTNTTTTLPPYAQWPYVSQS